MKVSDVLARYKPAEKLVKIQLDGSLDYEIEDLQHRITKTVKSEARDDPGLRSKLPDLQAQLETLQVAADDASLTIKLTAIPGKEFDRLKFEHPPKEEDWTRYREAHQANPTMSWAGQITAPEFSFDEFIPRLVGLSVVAIDGEAVEWSEDDGVQLWEELHDGARAALSNAAWEVNGKKSSVPLSDPATDTTSSSGGGSTTPASEESPSLTLKDE